MGGAERGWEGRPVKGQSFCFFDLPPLEKASLTRTVREHGGHVTFIAGKGTDVVVASDNLLADATTYRLQRCRERGIPVISGHQLRKRLAELEQLEGFQATTVSAAPLRGSEGLHETTEDSSSSMSGDKDAGVPTVTLAIPSSQLPNVGAFEIAVIGLGLQPSGLLGARLLSHAGDESLATTVEWHSSSAVVCKWPPFVLPAGAYGLSCTCDGVTFGPSVTVELSDSVNDTLNAATGNVGEEAVFMLCSQLRNIRRAIVNVQRSERDLTLEIQRLSAHFPSVDVVELLLEDSSASLSTNALPNIPQTAAKEDTVQVKKGSIPSQEGINQLEGESSTNVAPFGLSLGQPRSRLSSRTLRVFISSTFKDMQTERDFVMKRVMPQVRKMCSERDVVITCVDLRWGITSAQSEHSTSLLMCLREIEECSMFIGIVGERYGSFLPSSSGSDSAPLSVSIASEQQQLKNSFEIAAKEYPWITAYKDRSITELEMRYALMRHATFVEDADPGEEDWLSPRDSKRIPFPVKFFIRDPYFVEEVTENLRDSLRAESEAAAEKVAVLKADIESSRCHVAHYNRPEHFSELLHEALCEEVDEAFPHDDQLSDADKEDFRHQTFSNDRCRIFLADEDDFNVLDKYVSSEQDAPLCVTGAAGVGKSALLCNWARRHAQHHPEDVVIEHYIGCSPNSTDPCRTVARFMKEIANALHVSDTGVDADLEQFDSSKLLDEFPVWLSRTFRGKTRRTVLVLDGLDLLHDRDNAQELIWFPRTFPKNVRVIVSAASASQEEGSGVLVAHRTLERRRCPMLKIEPLNVGRRKSFCIQYLKMNHSKAFSEKQEQKIADAKQCANPRFLQTLLDDISVSAIHEDLDKRLEELLHVKDTSQLYERVIRRMESDYGRELVKALLSLIWTARIGLRMDDELAPAIQELLGQKCISASQWPTIYLILEALTTNSGGLLCFSNDDVKRAVRALYMRDPVQQKTMHGLLSCVFLEKLKESFYTTRMLEELPWHLARAGMLTELKESLCDVRMMDQFFCPQYQQDCLDYWALIHEKCPDSKAVDCYMDVIKRAHFPPTILRAELMCKAAKFLAEMNQFSGAEEMLCMAKQHYENSSSTLEVCRVEALLGELCAQQRKHDEAEKWFNVALRKYEKESSDSEELVVTMERLATLYINTGKTDNAKTILERALTICEKKFGGRVPVTANVIYSLGCIANIEARSGCGGLDQKKAEDWLRRSLELKTQLLGDWHPEVARVLNRLGAIFVEQNQFNDAEACYKQALTIREEKLGKNSSRALQTIKHLISCYEMQEKTELALEYCRRAMEVCESPLYGPSHPQTARVLVRIGDMLMTAGKRPEGIDALKRALAIQVEHLGKDHPDTKATAAVLALPPPPPPMPRTAFVLPVDEGPYAGRAANSSIKPGCHGKPPPPPPPPCASIGKYVPRASRGAPSDVLDEIRGLSLNKGEQSYDRSDAMAQVKSMIGAGSRKMMLNALR